MLGGISGAVTALPSRDGVCDPGSDIQTSPEGWSTSFAFCAAAADADTMTNTTKSADWAAIRIIHLPERNDCALRSAIAVRSGASAPPPWDECPRALVNVIEGCLGQDLSERHASRQGRASGDHGRDDEGVDASGCP